MKKARIARRPRPSATASPVVEPQCQCQTKKRAPRLLNVPAIVCSNVLGEKHTPRHRMFVGSVIMIAGVVFTKSMSDVHFMQFHIIADVLGYFLHGMGAVPFFEYLSKVEND